MRHNYLVSAVGFEQEALWGHMKDYFIVVSRAFSIYKGGMISYV